MTDEQINEKIAEFCGWKRVQEVPGADLWFCPPEPGTNMRGIRSSCPDYCNDLNACHELEHEVLGDWEDHSTLWHSYETKLKQVCGVRNHWMSASARQRAEAFLRTMKLWEE